MRREHLSCLLTFLRDKLSIFSHAPARLVCELIVYWSDTA